MAESTVTPLAVRRWSDLGAESRMSFVSRHAGAPFDSELYESIAEIVEDVRRGGDAAVLRALERWHDVHADVDGLRVGEGEFDRARELVPESVQEAIREAIAHSRAFNERVLDRACEWRAEMEPGLVVGEKRTPVASAGLFVPCGKGSYPSVVVQIGTPAVVAGVPHISIVVPPLPEPEGAVDPAVLVAADELGIHDVYRANGPAGIAALAFGTETFPQTLKVVGPGSPPVLAAQVAVGRYGTVNFLLLGPSEALVLADETADSHLLAADLLNEAEHGHDSVALLVTPSAELIAAVQAEVASQISELPEPRRGYARSALGGAGGAVLVDDLDEAVEVANLFAAEHLQLVVRDEDGVLARIQHAGEVLLGQATPISMANYVFGVPAALPTGRYARVNGGVSAETFSKTTSIAKASDVVVRRLAEHALALAEHEGFPAHAAAVRARVNDGNRHANC